MQGKWGIIWLAIALVTVSLTCAPMPALAVEAWSKGGMPLTLVGAQTPMEAQMLGEKPFKSPLAPISPDSDLLSSAVPSLQLDQDGGGIIKLPRHLEMKISFLYNRDNESNEPAYVGTVRRRNPLLMRSALDYRLLPNLRVGLNAYLYRPDSGDNLSLSKQLFGSQVMGLGPGLKYDLGNWSFVVKSQLETGGEHKDLQNWFRVWYAF
jgi:hypothetical protein